MQNTKFGWILAGPVYVVDSHSNSTNSGINNCLFTVNDELHNTVKKFWQVENKQSQLTIEELDCERHFQENVTTNSEGRYIGKLPLKENFRELGNSLNIAVNCLKSLERRLRNDPELFKQYDEFLKEYERLGHMTRVDPNLDNTNDISVYLSHHCVLKESSSTTKLRVVFNASLKTSTGVSLNDVLKVGPKVQKDVFDIVLRMRSYPILVVADIEKMYRMIRIHPSQRKLQRILWRNVLTDQEIVHYELNTVTYGTASASFLATRVLHEIGLHCKDSHPEVSKIIINNFYMDDLMFGGHDLT